MDHHEIIQLLQSTPVSASKIIVRRIQSKYNELVTLKNTKAKAIWDNIS